jgi:hypothetical protein
VSDAFASSRWMLPTYDAGLWLIECVVDIGKHVPDLLANDAENDDYHHGNQHQNECVFDHALTFFACADSCKLPGQPFLKTEEL